MSSDPLATEARETVPQHRSSAMNASQSHFARLILRLDGLFEGVLGVLLVTSPVTGLASALALPKPAVTPVLVMVGLLLLPLLPFLWLSSRTPRRQLLRSLAIANGAGSALFVAWVAIWHTGFTRPGGAFVLAVAVVLGILAALQARIRL